MLPFFPQERPESCVPACLRMVLASADRHLSEALLYESCATDLDGTLPNQAAQAATMLGFAATAERLSSVADLHKCMTSGSPNPIVFVNLSVILGINVNHAVIIESIDLQAQTVSVVDPAFPPTGRRIWSLSLFEIGWSMARRQTILISTV